MFLSIRHALLEISNQPTTKKSAILINNEILLTSGSVMLPYLRPIKPVNVDSEDASGKIIRALERGQLVSAQEANSSDEAQLLNALNYQVTFERKKMPGNASDSANPHILTRYHARALYLFSCPELSRNLLKLLQPFDQTEIGNEILFSSFMVLSVCPHAEQEESFQRFLTHIAHYLRYLTPVRSLDDVLVMCTPFGLENFYKTISIGKISNVMGPSGCLFSISCALPAGCEGSAVFNKRLRLIGVIISTCFQRHNENVNLTLTANFAYLLRDFMRQLDRPISSITLQRPMSKFTWESTMVAIDVNGHQGTGTFVKVNNKKKFILTCTHVVFNVASKVSCRGADGAFTTDVIWHNPQYDKPFDVALLAAPANIPDSYFVRLSQRKPTPGLAIYNAGFPYYVNFNLKYDFNPSIFEGRIIKCSRGAIMSDGCVQAGQSGGPMFDQNGCILGICVSNIKLDNVIYPNINTAVPICDIRITLEKYANTNDVSVLADLVGNAEMQSIWSLDAPNIVNKL